MKFFDHYFEGNVSDIGLLIEKKQNKYIFSHINTFIRDKNVNLLEIGTGKGHFARTCKGKSINYVGIEPNEKQADTLKKEGFEITCCYIPPIPCKDNFFNIIYCAHVLEHMNDFKMAQNMIQEIYNKLTVNGYIVIVGPNYLDWRDEFFNCDFTHNYVTTPRRVAQLLTDNGFQVVDTLLFSGFLFGGKRFIVKYLNRLYPWKWFDVLFGKYFHAGFFYKAKLTFSENFLIIAKKIEK
ncbi:MAG: class I SAM-dependent methyltransferase [Candidatus Schekmanbacteria bacterium]|nr:class I SAM-dependent methyltransferase [Candidatus Schekmanbacteria bacterium]